ASSPSHPSGSKTCESSLKWTVNARADHARPTPDAYDVDQVRAAVDGLDELETALKSEPRYGMAVR
ncbi:MAG: hypothetical protein ACU0BN_10515, partial [Sulfitobacter sp.]